MNQPLFVIDKVGQAQHPFILDKKAKKSKEVQLEELVFGKKRLKTKDAQTNKDNNAAWVDSDDFKSSDDIYVSDTLRFNQKPGEIFSYKLQNNDWADVAPIENNEFSDNVKNVIVKTKSKYKPPLLTHQSIKYKYLTNLNYHYGSSETNKGSKNIAKYKISDIKFHVIQPLLLSTNTRGLVRFYKTTFSGNEEIQRLTLEKFSISSSAFLGDPLAFNQALFLSADAAKFLYCLDLPTGKLSQFYPKSRYTSVNPKYCSTSDDGSLVALYSDSYGKIDLLHSKSKETIHTFHTINSNCVGVKFGHKSRYLYALSEMGEIYCWDLQNMKTMSYAASTTKLELNTMQDKGNYQATCLAVTPLNTTQGQQNGPYLFTGSNSGVVNCYDISSPACALQPAFVKSWKNISVPIDNLCPNRTGQYLTMSSSYKCDTIKMINLSTLSVITNFPIDAHHNKQRSQGMLQKRIFGDITASDWSPNSAYFACGTKQSGLHILKMTDYKKY